MLAASGFEHNLTSDTLTAQPAAVVPTSGDPRKPAARQHQTLGPLAVPGISRPKTLDPKVVHRMVAILQPTKQGRVIPIDRAVVLVGRGSDCDAAIRGSQKISRRHCCLVQVDDAYFVRDLGSMNGVWLNGDRVEREARLKAGDTLCIGDVEFLFHPNARIETRSPGASPESLPLPAPPAPPPAAGPVPPRADPKDQVIPLSDAPEIIDDVIPLDELDQLEEGDGPDEEEDVLIETNEYEIIDERLDNPDDDEFDDRLRLDE